MLEAQGNDKISLETKQTGGQHGFNIQSTLSIYGEEGKDKITLTAAEKNNKDGFRHAGRAIGVAGSGDDSVKLKCKNDGDFVTTGALFRLDGEADFDKVTTFAGPTRLNFEKTKITS